MALTRLRWPVDQSKVAALDPTAVGGLSADQMKAFDPTAMAGFDASQVAALDPTDGWV